MKRALVAAALFAAFTQVHATQQIETDLDGNASALQASEMPKKKGS